jgi:hypothetical protein
VKHLASLVDGPPPERAQHNRVTRDQQTVADAYGNIGRPWRAETMLERLQRQGDIEPLERAAGEEFHRLFRRASLDPLRAADMAEPSRGVGRDSHASQRPKQEIHFALNALGGYASPCGSCAWFVLGCEMSVNQWASRRGIRREVAKGVLVATLGVLAKHFA